MLDKSVPYLDILMKRPAGTKIPVYSLPEGYRYVLYRPGDEIAWAELEFSVLEFPNPEKGLALFQQTFLPDQEELKRRCLFIEDSTGQKLATAMAWWNMTGKQRDAWLHWVSVSPKSQGLGLGKAVVSKALHLLLEIEGDRDIYLHTQTWSHKAVGIYLKCGFQISGEKKDNAGDQFDNRRAVEILKECGVQAEWAGD